MKIRFKKLHPFATPPTRAKPGDAGFDLVALTDGYDRERLCYIYGTGIAVEIPRGYFGAVFQRSSVRDRNLILSNCVSVIDSGYRGEITFSFRYIAGGGLPYTVGERIGQLVILPLPEVEFEEAAELSESERGDGGFGSTGV